VKYAKAVYCAAYAEAVDYYLVSVIQNGVPIDTPAVQLAKATHFAAIAIGNIQNHVEEKYYTRKKRPNNTFMLNSSTMANMDTKTPVDTEASQHAAHMIKVAEAQTNS
jgi:hypothetical protein